MAKINLRDYYPFYQHDEYVEVSDELAAELSQWERSESTQKRKKYRYHAHYSLDWGMKSVGTYFSGWLHRMSIMKSVSPLNSFMLQ